MTISMTAVTVAFVVLFLLLMVRAGVSGRARSWESVRLRFGRPATMPEARPAEDPLPFAGLGLALPPRGTGAAMTARQRDALLGLGLASVPPLSEDQARTLISASLYAEVVFRTVSAPGAHCPAAKRWRAVGLILADAALREAAETWIASRYRGGGRGVPVRETPPYRRVRAALTRDV